MPHAQMRINGGVDTNETPALNQAGISTCNLIRYMPDPSGLLLVQKIGGWTRYFPNTMVAPVRALWAWEDTDAVAHLGYGTQNIGNTSSAQLGVITTGSQLNITPTSTTDDVAPSATTVTGSSSVSITDSTTGNITSYDSVFIETHLAVDGLLLFGQYPTIAGNSTAYSIIATDILGNPVAATGNATTATVAAFAVTTGSNVVTVTLANHGYTPGSTYPVLVSTTLGNVTLYGNYIVNSVGNTSAFTILGSNVATGNTSASINGGNARYVYSFGVGAVPVGSGYGRGGYGRGGYGTGTGVVPATGTAISATDWTLDNWGETFLACPINNTLYQPIYQWNPLSGSPTATVIPNAPTVNDGMFVAMPERQIIAWGSTFTGIQDPLLIRWCDVNNYNVWIGTVTNQAGSYRIPKGSKIVGCIQGPQQCIIWTDIDVWGMQYINQPNIWGFNELASGCGLIGRKAMAALNGIVYWMGASQFFALSDNGVNPIPCPIWDVIFQNLDQTNLSKIRVAVNSRFGEIAWYYPTISSGGEVAAYVKYNIMMPPGQQWDFGTLSRSAWIDQSVLGPPIGADPNLEYLYQHETSPDADGQALPASFQTGYMTIGDGEYKTFIDQFWPDAKYGYYGGTQNATINLTFYVVDYPGQTPQVFGPYALTQGTTFITPRFRGRLVSIGISSNDIGTWWRTGGSRYRYIPDGKF